MWGYCEGLLHDIGKYSEEFQGKITENFDGMVDHSTAGAKVCAEKAGNTDLKTVNGRRSEMIRNCIEAGARYLL